jgi:hypothetical protein
MQEAREFRPSPMRRSDIVGRCLGDRWRGIVVGRSASPQRFGEESCAVRHLGAEVANRHKSDRRDEEHGRVGDSHAARTRSVLPARRLGRECSERDAEHGESDSEQLVAVERRTAVARFVGEGEAARDGDRRGEGVAPRQWNDGRRTLALTVNPPHRFENHERSNESDRQVQHHRMGATDECDEGLHRAHARMPRTGSPKTSVSRKSRPWWR